MFMAEHFKLLRMWLLPCVLLLFQSIAAPVHGRERGGGKGNKSMARAAGIDTRFWAPNRIGTYITNNGTIVDYHPTGSAGMEWPVG